jgi:TetR/AcrR family transcriptional regulator
MSAANKTTTSKRTGGSSGKPPRRGKGRPATKGAGVGREALIAKTCELLRRFPPSQLTRSAVARAANADPATVRYHFPDASTLLLAATERLTTEFLVLLEDEMAGKSASPSERLRARITALLNLNIAHPFFWRLIEHVSNMNSPAACTLLADLTARGLGAYTEIVQAGDADGTFRGVNPALLFLGVVGLCEYCVVGAPVIKLALGRNLRKSELESQYRDFICDLVLRSLQAGAGRGR